MGLENTFSTYIALGAGDRQLVDEFVFALANDATADDDYAPNPATGARRLTAHDALISELEDIADNETGVRAKYARQLLAMPVFTRGLKFFWLFDQPTKWRVWSNARLQRRMFEARRGFRALPSQYDDPTEFQLWTKTHDGLTWGLPVDDETNFMAELHAIVNHGLEHGVAQPENALESRR